MIGFCAEGHADVQPWHPMRLQLPFTCYDRRLTRRENPLRKMQDASLVGISQSLPCGQGQVRVSEGK